MKGARVKGERVKAEKVKGEIMRGASNCAMQSPKSSHLPYCHSVRQWHGGVKGGRVKG